MTTVALCKCPRCGGDAYVSVGTDEYQDGTLYDYLTMYCETGCRCVIGDHEDDFPDLP